VILIDTSVWIDHFRSESPFLSDTLDLGEVLTHPFVMGELACGMLRQRREVLHLLADLPQATVASYEEVLHFIEERRLMGKGIGYVDAHLLAAVSLTEGAQLWTHDKRLAAVATDLRLGLPRN
jgi:predicted nucleic acid-binding protein